MIAFVYPGQGSQSMGMAKDFIEGWPELHEFFKEADDVVGFPLSKLSCSGTQAELQKTEIAQPALFALGVAIHMLLAKAGIKPAYAAGHSLGEYTAYAMSGAVGCWPALKLVARRGHLMGAADPEGHGAMASILGLDDHIVEALCEKASAYGPVVPANYNCSGQLVVSGLRKAVEEVCRLCREERGRGILLPVSGAFHSPLMDDARGLLLESLNETEWHDGQWPVVSNLSGRPVAETADIPKSLSNQLVSPVQWTRSIRFMVDQGVSHFIAIGPGRVLSGLIRRISPEILCTSLNDAEALNKFIDEGL